MKSNPLGASGVRVSEMGLGTAQLGDLYRPLTAQDCVDIVDAAWNEGIRYFDTAPFYGFGLAERRLGDALRTYPRSEYTLSSKVGRILTGREAEPRFRWDFSAEGVRASLDTSLHRLGTTHIDLVLIHDPQEHLDWALNEALPALEALRDNGEVGAIGVGSGSVEALVAFAETGARRCAHGRGPLHAARAPRRRATAAALRRERHLGDQRGRVQQRTSGGRRAATGQPLRIPGRARRTARAGERAG